MKIGSAVMRVFSVRPKPGCEDALAEKLASTSVDVVRGQPGNIGHLLGRSPGEHARDFVFVSLWEDLDAVAAHFGVDWEQSFLPPGYAELIEACSIEHFEIGGEIGAADI